MQAQKAEGTRDLIGAEMRAWQKMQQIAAGVFEPFGFKPIETPAIEQVDVFVHGIGQSTDVVRKGNVPRVQRCQPGARLCRRAPTPNSSPSSAWHFAPRARPAWCAPSSRTIWCPRAPRRLRLTTPRPCSAAGVPRRAACASSTRWASSGSALPIRRQTPSASSCSWSSTSAWASIFPSFVCSHQLDG